MLRLILIYLPKTFNLASRPEVSTPLVSLRRRKYSLSFSLTLRPHSLILFSLSAFLLLI
jgi:hypothetical protein